MSIRFEDSTFLLETDHTAYQMRVDRFGVLVHVWYGARTGCVMDYLLDYPEVSFAGSIYEAGNERNYSLNTLSQEYPSYGVGDFRVPAICVTHKDGSRALDLRYKEHRIYAGKYSIPGLPAVYAQEQEADTLEITLRDTASPVEVVLRYGVLPAADVITRSTIIRNTSEDSVCIDRAHSLCLDIVDGAGLESMHFYGKHAMERQAERMPLAHGIFESSSRRGASSHQQNPTILLCEHGCTETQGMCFGAALLYSGSFQTQIEKDQVDQVRLVMGIDPESFTWKLASGEQFYTPEVILSCSAEGMARLSQQFHRVIRQHVCRGRYQLSRRPVLINNWEATYFSFNTEKILKIARDASELGIDLLVLDDGWFGKRNDDMSGLGDWYVNEEKLPGGLDPLIEQIHAYGMKFGLWFEPEMVSEDSALYRAHPEWVIRIPGRAPMRSRYQLVLNMADPQVTEYLYQRISTILRQHMVEYVKWDMNRSISDWYSVTLDAEWQQEQPHRYVLGLYALLERLTKEFPDVLWEGCSGGGGRFDAGMLYYCPQIWCSDDTDAHERTKIQYGTSFFYPISSVGAHVSAVPNHQTGRSVSLKTRGIVAMAGSFGYEMNLGRLSDGEKQMMKEQICTYKERQPLIHDGLYYRLTDPMQGDMAAWEWHDPKSGQVLVQGVVYRTQPNCLKRRVRLMGLDPEGQYCLQTSEKDVDQRLYTGMALMQGGVLLELDREDDAGFELFFTRKESHGNQRKDVKEI